MPYRTMAKMSNEKIKLIRDDAEEFLVKLEKAK
jgi:hypothetical protein